MQNDIIVNLWRRGRGFLSWTFTYLDEIAVDNLKKKGYRGVVTTPGWYHAGRNNLYRITIDHDYPEKPIWLGYRRRGKWVNAEGLYEPLLVTHANFVVANKTFNKNRPWRSHERIVSSGKFVENTVDNIITRVTYGV